MRDILENEGRVWARGALSEHDLNIMTRAMGRVSAGQRLAWSPDLCKVAGTQSRLTDLAGELLDGAAAVRLVAFDKSTQTNWALPWHQDRVIAIEDALSAPGFSNLSKKSGIWHCEPPVSLLKTMIFARVHFSRNDAETGAMEISLGSHKFGKVSASEIDAVVRQLPTETCTAERGDVLFVKALTLHRSSASSSMQSRAALRVDFSNQQLPPPLQWYY